MAEYTVRGQIHNVNNLKFYVEILDNDQHWFDDRINDLLGSSWTDDSGKFEVTFIDEAYRDNWLEGKPELFVIVRNELGVICHTTKTKSPSNPNDAANLTFDITIQKENSFDDSPYDAANIKRIAAFARVGDSIDLTDNVRNSFRLLTQTINAWLLYTNESKWNLIKYDGPQVERYPWRNQHTHKLKWDNGS
ncbi:MAG: hypothetical protein OEL56_05910 [Nitrosopumilus sp.]|nr:hypothetical protein [Nitrosopumilus sp.]MDH3516039.1 hypothetical protein [Nitrosopumilus sp.]MDH3564526.1 hypothetical protein [Nitrosopumilus sp.]MDH5417397.1 hypothetical protein [Nitrosopumilus sp.]MDH5555511.1 hypothetical protein [Nitrosopumilus sp.]